MKAIDYPQWNEGGSIFNKDLTVPQFNLRFGWFLEQQHKWAVEFSVDHSKYSTVLNQPSHITGTLNGQPVDQDVVLTPATFNYRLHNGVNHIMLSLVKRTPLLGELNSSLSLSMLIKGGAGLILPHAESTIMGNDSDVGPKKLSNLVGTRSGWWQLNGWTAGAEVAMRFVMVRPIWLEISDKVAYAKLWNVPVYQGRADQILWMNAIMLAFGVTLNDHNTNDQNNGP